MRPAVAIPTLANSGVAGKKRAAHLQEFLLTGTSPTNFADHWNNSDVRGLLLAMQSHICAYCALDVRTLDVEHFRPKATIHGEPPGTPGYWWLAYEVSNYFLGCTECNQRLKGTKFPLLNNATRVTFATRNRIAGERRLLLDPVEDRDVETLFHIEWSDQTCELVPAPGLATAERRRVVDVIDFFNLNLDPIVRKHRSKVYLDAVKIANDKAWHDLRSVAMRHREHSFAARFVLQALKQRLPSAEEETQDLAATQWLVLRGQVKAILDLEGRGETPRPTDIRLMESPCWALIVLKNHGTADQRKAVEELLIRWLGNEQEAAIRDRILRLFGKLSASLP